MSKAENLFRAAYERLKANKPINLPSGTPVTQNNIAKEAGKHPTALKKDRFPLLVLEIQDYLKQQEIDSDIFNKKKQLRKKRTLEDRLADCQKQRSKLSSICEAQSQLIEDLMGEIDDYKNGYSKPSPLPEIKS
jgi:DNA primase large subunit